MLLECLQRRFGSDKVRLGSHKLRDVFGLGWCVLLRTLFSITIILSPQRTLDCVFCDLGALLHRLMQCLLAFSNEIVQKGLHNLLCIAFADFLRAEMVPRRLSHSMSENGCDKGGSDLPG